MEVVAISKFKAERLAILERVRRIGQPVLVARFGERVASFPRPLPSRPEGWLGRYRSQGRIVGDIVSPVAEPMEWEANRW